VPRILPINQRYILHCFALAALLVLPFSLLADVLVVTGAKSSLITLSKNQVSDVFLGKVASLPDGSSATPIDQSESSPLRDEFYLKVTNKSAAQAKAHWAKLYFTGRGVPPHECIDSGDIKKTLNSTPGTIGYIERSSLDNSVKVIFVAQ
jgi:ABC-type phosphate transport system substrate-binding protein